ncbi:hypothetical protein T11_13134 [Trichinella zimbabwensis]|uniref:Uncharacterized protein n=1 Tax=Trichinella zimbabwensis TaxID=268475 RepID=A0A0V1GEL0_9BILA|nr:hypothetical protein T11_13134 [Trichinella zimbabwensis]
MEVEFHLLREAFIWLFCTLCKSAQINRSTNSGIRTSGRFHYQLH